MVASRKEKHAAYKFKIQCKTSLLILFRNGLSANKAGHTHTPSSNMIAVVFISMHLFSVWNVDIREKTSININRFADDSALFS